MYPTTIVPIGMQMFSNDQMTLSIHLKTGGVVKTELQSSPPTSSATFGRYLLQRADDVVDQET